MSKMNRRQLFLSAAKAAFAAAFGGSWLSGKAKAQTQAGDPPRPMPRFTARREARMPPCLSKAAFCRPPPRRSAA
jgi:hypothetical protein